MTERSDPYRNFRYQFKQGDQILFYCADVSGLLAGASLPVREGGATPRKRPGAIQYGNLTAKRGVFASPAAQGWAQTMETNFERKTLTISVLDETGKERETWQVVNAWPVKYSASEFKGNDNEVLFETIELAHEGVTRLL